MTMHEKTIYRVLAVVEKFYYILVIGTDVVMLVTKNPSVFVWVGCYVL